MRTCLDLGMHNALRTARIALVHDYLVQDGGAERVLLTLHRMFPEAPIYVLLHNPNITQGRFDGCEIRTSFLQRLPLTPKRYQWTLPLMPVAVEHFDFSAYDLVISSTSSFAKGIITPPGTAHVCYCHTPTRFLWQERVNYVHDLPQPRTLRPFLLPLLHRIRQWDVLAASRPDVLVTNSETSRTRIRRYYHRDAAVITPPVDVDAFSVSGAPGSYWLTGGRLVPYKRFDLTVRAFTKLNIPLVVFGTGPEEKKLRKMAGRNTTFLGHVSDAKRAELYRDAIGFVCPQMEDFGITIIEAMASGRPVITYGKGGGSESVINGVTGIHLEEQTWEDVGDAIIRFDASQFDPYAIRRYAERYAPARFIRDLEHTLLHALDH